MLRNSILLISVLSFTGCLHKTEITPRPSDKAIVKSHQALVIAPFINDRYDFQNALYRAFLKEHNYDVRKEAPKEREVVHTDEMRIQGTLSIPKTKSRHYFKEQTTCQKEHCWRQKVLCLERNSSIEVSFSIYDNHTRKIVYQKERGEKDLLTHCADDPSAIPSINAVLTSLTEKIAIDLVEELSADRN